MHSIRRLECRNNLRRDEGGMALLVVLVMLVLISLIAVVGAEDSQLQTRMSANSQRHEVATYSAETLLVRLERRLESGLDDGSRTLSDFENGAADGLYNLVDGSASSLDPLSEASWNDNGKAWDGAGSETGRYIIEHLGPLGPPPLNVANAGLERRLHVFRITVRGESGGGQRGVTAVVQSDVYLGVL